MRRRYAAAGAIALALCAVAVWIAMQHEEPRASPPPVIEAAPPQNACDLLEERNASALATDACAAATFETACVVDGSFAFGIRIDDVTISPECEVHLQLRVVRVGGDASTLSSDAIAIDEASNVQNAFTLRVLSDYDGDGNRELFVSQTIKRHAGGIEQRGRLFTVAHGRIEPYGPATGFAIADAVDADGDGRLDLLTRGPYGDVSVDGSYTIPQIAPPFFLAHALPSGNFSADDAVVRTYARGKCPSGPLSLRGTRDAIHGDAAAVVCARVRGIDGAKIDAAIARACRSDAAFGCDSWLKRLAAIAPPFVLQSD